MPPVLFKSKIIETKKEAAKVAETRTLTTSVALLKRADGGFSLRRVELGKEVGYSGVSATIVCWPGRKNCIAAKNVLELVVPNFATTDQVMTVALKKSGDVFKRKLVSLNAHVVNRTLQTKQYRSEIAKPLDQHCGAEQMGGKDMTI